MLETFISQKVTIGFQLELETVGGEGCAPEIPVVSRRESIMMVELTKHIPGTSYFAGYYLYSVNH